MERTLKYKDTIKSEEIRVQYVYGKRGFDQRYIWFNEGHLFFIQERERQVLKLLKANCCSDLKILKILEVGCGNGYWLQEFVKWGASPENITGIEIIPERLSQARKNCSPGITIEYGNGVDLPYGNESFDIVLQSTVFTSILDLDIKMKIASEMLRVLHPGGFILWYDFHMNNPWNKHVKGVKKNEIGQLFPCCKKKIGRITLAPPLYRHLGPISWGFCYFLEKLKIFNTHYLGTIRKLKSGT